ncbi:MAG TPA: phospholipase D-like domain-containing protein [Myxococcota bacterium]|jgi:phosphatidylserine/phosphatidylglycerophosphate/cardiolipin synthase-like enzyme
MMQMLTRAVAGLALFVASGCIYVTVPGHHAQAGEGEGEGAAPGTLSQDVTVIVEPSDHGDAMRAAIRAATQSVHMTMYILSDDDTVSAILDRASAGLDVKVVLNGSFPSGTGNANDDAYNTLHGAGVDVVYSSSAFTFTHEKCVIIDGSSAWVMTMNAAYSSPRDNREYLAVDNDAADVVEAEAIFAADFAHTTPSVSGNLLVAPVNVKDGIRALINGAENSIDVEMEELSDNDVVNDLALQAHAGLTVRAVIADNDLSSAQSHAAANLKNAGVQVVKLSSPYVHAKAIVVDGARAYVGSANMTTTSLEHNRELGLVTDTAATVAKVAATVDEDISGGTSL